MPNKAWFILLISTIVNVACSKSSVNPVDRATKDDHIIQSYLAKHALDATPTGSGLYVMVSDSGQGNHPTIDDSITVTYRGYFTNGGVFDSTKTPTDFALSNVIEGWQEGIPYFKPGGSGMLFVPSALGYGSKAIGTIPANSVLIFKLQLIAVK